MQSKQENLVIPNNAPNNLVEQLMSSREIAELTEKQHSNIMRDIRIMVESLQNSNLNSASKLSYVCVSTNYLGENGQNYPQYELDKETTLCLIAGYDVVLRMKIIKRWKELELLLQSQTVPQTSLSPLQLFEVMLQQAKEQEAKLLEQSKKLTIIEDKVNELQAHNTTHQTDYFTVSGYYRFVGMKYNLTPAEGQKMGKSLTALSNVLNFNIQKVSDMKFGTVGAYHIDIFKTYFEKKQVA